MPPATPCFLGLDLGTSGCRAVAVDDHGTVIAQASAPLPATHRPQQGHSEQDPLDWWLAVERVLGELAAHCPGQARSLCVDGTSATLLLCDQNGEPCTPALMYDDRRATAQAALIEQVAPAASPTRSPASALAKLLWLRQTLPKIEACYALHQADWVTGRLSGRFGHSDEHNALKLGFDPVDRRWPDWISELPLERALLPQVHPSGETLGQLAPPIARHLGLPLDTLLVAGTTDGNAAALAAGAGALGDAVTSLGSTLVLKILSDRPVAAAQYGVYSHRIGNCWLASGASNSGGCVLRQYFSAAELVELSPRIAPDRPLNLRYYPLPTSGERFPHNDPEMQPRLTPRPTKKSAFLQAILEGIADIEAAGYRRLAELGAAYPSRVLTSGGGAVNEAWRQIREHRLGVPVQRATQTQPAYGAALLARAALGRDSALQPTQ